MNYFIKTYLKSVEKSLVEHTTFLNTLPLPILNESERLLCKGAFTEKELHDEYGPRKITWKQQIEQRVLKLLLGRIKRTFCYLN